MRRAEALPAWRDAWAVVRGAAEALRPPRGVTVAEAAERHIRFRRKVGYSGPWRNDMAPHLVEPMALVTSRIIDELVFMGPSQNGKSALMLASVAHGALYRPADMLIFQPTQAAAEDFKARRLDGELIAWGEGLAEAVGSDRSDDTRHTLKFRSGMRVDVSWPTVTNLASRPVPIVWLDERDRMADDIGGEGDPVELARRRVTNFKPEGMVGVVGSPSRSDGTGIIARWRRGWRCRYHMPCQHCGVWWAPGFDADGRETTADVYIPAGCEDAEEARESAGLLCPSCGTVHTEAERVAGLRAGRWVADGETVAEDGTVSGEGRRGRVASFWLAGPCNPFKPVSDLAAELVAARREFDETGDEKPLQTVMNTGFGFPYVRKADGLAPLDAGEVAERKGAHRLGQVPAGVRFLVAAVDVQGDRWEVAVWGYSERAEAWLVDRYAIKEVGGREVAPHLHPEKWPVLLPRVLGRRYPLADDPARGLAPAVMAVDTGGMDGVMEAAKNFWRTARRLGVAADRLMLVKGATVATAPILARPSFEVVAGKPNKGGVRWYMVGVAAAKDLAANRLRRTEPGPGAVHLPHDLERRHLEELTAERKEGGAWVKVRRRNETWDLLVYSIAAFVRLRPAAVDWSAPPAWAMPVPMDAPEEFGPEVLTDGAAAADAVAVVRPAARPVAPADRPAVPVEAPPADAVAALLAEAPPAAPSRRARRPGGFVRNW